MTEPLPDAKRIFRTPENRDRLRQILTDPVFIAACQIVEERWRVEPAKLFTQTPLADPVIARQASYHAAMQSFPLQLADLTKTPSDPTPPLQGWDHVTPDQTTDTL
jgi:hypothetical protein